MTTDGPDTPQFTVRAIGQAHTPYLEPKDAPRQGRLSPTDAELEIFEHCVDGLKDVEAATHLIVLYWGHLADRDVLQTVTPWGPEVRGVFACRSPARPNPISLCVVRLLGRTGNTLHVRGLDAVDGSYILDIKPYSARIDGVEDAQVGWLEAKLP